MLSNDVKALQPGQGCPRLLDRPHGRLASIERRSGPSRHRRARCWRSADTFARSGELFGTIHCDTMAGVKPSRSGGDASLPHGGFSPGRARHGRDLPWRRSREPYRVSSPEIMLQQTQVDRRQSPSTTSPDALPDLRGPGPRPCARSDEGLAPARLLSAARQSSRHRARNRRPLEGRLPEDGAASRGA